MLKCLQSLRSLQYGSCLAFVDSESICRHEICRPTECLLDENTTLCVIRSLHAVIRQDHGVGCRLTNGNAHRLAVSLATGILQFHDTPWLESNWNRLGISVIEKNGKLVARHPFLSRSLQASDGQGSGGQHRDETAGIIRNSTLFAFGILLIELCMGMSIDDLHTANELDGTGMKDGLSNFKTAARLLANEDISDRFGKRYSDVVYRCIYCDLGHTRCSLADPGFRAAVYAYVVLELEEGCRQFFSLC